MGKKKGKLSTLARGRGLKMKENCPITGKVLHLTQMKDGRLAYTGGPYMKGKNKVKTLIYIS